METCDNCGAEINDDNETTRMCPECGVMLCEQCDAGAGTVCADCEASDDL